MNLKRKHLSAPPSKRDKTAQSFFFVRSVPRECLVRRLRRKTRKGGSHALVLFLSVFREEIFESSNAFSLLNSVRKEDFRVWSRLAAVFPLLSFSSVRNLHPRSSFARNYQRRKEKEN